MACSASAANVLANPITVTFVRCVFDIGALGDRARGWAPNRDPASARSRLRPQRRLQ